MGRTVDGAATRGVGTLTLGFLQWPRLHLVHVGDGRCYLFRHGLQQLTTDHTLLQQLVDEGRLPMRTNEKTPLGQPTRNEIGAAADQFVDVSKVEMRPGDTLMLCTDGLVHDLHDADIGAILGGNEPAAAMVRNLVEAADARDGTDGFTVIVARMPSAVDPGEQHEVRLAQDPPDEGAGSPS
jgi:protein phosphatase